MKENQKWEDSEDKLSWPGNKATGVLRDQSEVRTG